MNSKDNKNIRRIRRPTKIFSKNKNKKKKKQNCKGNGITKVNRNIEMMIRSVISIGIVLITLIVIMEEYPL